MSPDLYKCKYLYVYSGIYDILHLKHINVYNKHNASNTECRNKTALDGVNG